VCDIAWSVANAIFQLLTGSYAASSNLLDETSCSLRTPKAQAYTMYGYRSILQMQNKAEESLDSNCWPCRMILTVGVSFGNKHKSIPYSLGAWENQHSSARLDSSETVGDEQLDPSSVSPSRFEA
jgi:hypothetical protein